MKGTRDSTHLRGGGCEGGSVHEVVQAGRSLDVRGGAEHLVGIQRRRWVIPVDNAAQDGALSSCCCEHTGQS